MLKIATNLNVFDFASINFLYCHFLKRIFEFLTWRFIKFCWEGGKQKLDMLKKNNKKKKAI